MVLHPEGQAVWNSSTSKWEYEYDVKDHLGNTRASFAPTTDKVKVLQTRDYYPFGMEMANWYVNDANATKFRYNGKELQDEGGLGWYDYGARFYDPELGRWHSADPLAENYYRWSPYNYSINNPIRFIDPDGNGIFDKVINAGKQWIAKETKELVAQSVISVGNAAKELGKDIAENTKLELKGEVKLTEELGAEYNLKGIGGGGMAIQMSEASIEPNVSIGLDGDFDSAGLNGKSNTDVTYRVTGQVKGNGASMEYTSGEDGNTSGKGTFTTTTGIPGVQTESSLKHGTKETEIAGGAAIGVKTPIAVTNRGTLVHFSAGVSLKIVYQKKEE